jgi:glycosyltransferase involved in cell wall biosynthesis
VRIALVHDWLCGYRGGEAVLERLARVAQRLGTLTRVYTMFDDGLGMRPSTSDPTACPTIDALPHSASLLNRLPGGPRRLRRWLLPLYPAACAHLSLAIRADHAREPIDLLLSTSSAWAKNVRAPAGVPHLCYCHAPPRYLWSRAADYRGGLRGLGLTLTKPILRTLDQRGTAHATRLLANSTHTRSEIRRVYGRDAEVLHPFARTDYFTPGEPNAERYWLAAGALEPYKRFDVAIDAARLAGVRLVVAGDGSQRESLEQHAAGADVDFRGRVSDAELRELYRGARAYLFPQTEDFGITAVEAQACGCPVAARDEGGARDTVEQGVTGVRFPPSGDAQALADAATKAERLDRAACVAHAQRFSPERFDAGAEAAIRAAVGG